jgi:N-acetylglucosamine repressor
MTNDIVGNNKFLKKLNKAIVLDLIRSNKELSKISLSQLTGLSPTATGMIVMQLLEEGYIHEIGIGESSGGRKPVLLELKPHSFYSIGADIDVDFIYLALIDITGEVVYEKSIKRKDNSNPEAALKFIENEILMILKEYSIDFSRLLGVGISIPGLVDEVDGKIILAPNLQWENVKASSYLTKLSGTPLYIENEAMASAVCEHWVGQCQGIDDFLCINITSGIGAGIFTGGKLYRGTGGSAGEIGHTLIDENGPKCGCGNYGCLETLASTKSIIESAKKIVRQGII